LEASSLFRVNNAELSTVERRGPERKLAEGLFWGLQWHPSGEWLVLVDRNSADEPFALYFLSIATGERRRLTWPPRSIGDVDGSVSPDGRTLDVSTLGLKIIVN